MSTDSSDSEYERDGWEDRFALHDAAESGDAKLLEHLLSNRIGESLVNLSDRNQSTPLHLAITGGHPVCVSVLLRAGASPRKPCDGSPPLALAVCLGLSACEQRAMRGEQCARALLEAGANPQDKDDGGRTALHWAACSGRTALTGPLLAAATQRARAHAQQQVMDGMFELDLQATRSLTAAVAATAGTSVGGGGEGGSHAAMMMGVGAPGGVERPEHILAVADHDGYTALHLAAKYGHAHLIPHLLVEAADSAHIAAEIALQLADKATSASSGPTRSNAAAATTTSTPLADATPPKPPTVTHTPSEADPATSPTAPSSPRPAPAMPPPPAAAIELLLPVCSPASLLKAKTRQEAHTPLHLAALYGRINVMAALLAAASGIPSGVGGGSMLARVGRGWGSRSGVVAALSLADKKGRTALDLAVRHGHVALASRLRAFLAGEPFDPSPPPANSTLSPQPDNVASGDGCIPSPSDPASSDVDIGGAVNGVTVLLAPDECLLHRTAPEPVSRGAREPPPENVNRLHVLTRPVTGILHNTEFADLRWRTRGVPQAAMVDVLKCHEWSYIREVMQACDALPDSPSVVGSLDADTAISRHSLRAALAAAGAVCAAVDEVVTRKARNAFCAVRPPGHHAGPHGVVTNPNDSHGSHGFCLLSNVAIGAAYAMAQHRHAGIRRVAILDFDVHHGNGTQACVLNTAPSIRTVPLRTPFSEGTQRFPTYKPWMGDGDAHNIFFASVQGFGRLSAIGFFYPGSGDTADSALAPTLAPATAQLTPTGTQDERQQPTALTSSSPPAHRGPDAATTNTTAAAAAGGLGDSPVPPPASSALAPVSGPGPIPAPDSANAGSTSPKVAATAAGAVVDVDMGAGSPPDRSGLAGVNGGVCGDGDGGMIPEDPDGIFRGSYDVTVLGGPRVINVGIPGPGGKPRMWRRAWRDKILPALMNFKPDLIMVSAGFDAHKKEDLNARYVGVTEADYEWLTGQIVEVANACCGGRVVSVLEGGYNLRGGSLGSAFARSVAAHVRGLLTSSSAKYDPADAEAERAAERAIEARKAAKAAAAHAAAFGGASLATPRSSLPSPRGGPPPLAIPGAAAAAAAAGAAAAAAAAAAASGTPPSAAPAPMDTDRSCVTPPSTGGAGADGASVPNEGTGTSGGGVSGGGGEGDEPPSKRRRRPAVDYAALNAQLEREAAAGGGPAGVGAGLME